MRKYKSLIIFLSMLIFSILCYIGLILLTINNDINVFVSIVLQAIGLILVIPLFIAVHEGGHMVFGLISGYSLMSYKIGPFEWYKKDEKIAFRVNSLSGVVLGQCLMIPPKPKKKVKPKFFLYNAGGLIFSYLMDVVLIVLFFVIDNGYIKSLLIPMISISLFLTINNSVYQKGGINDVCNHVMIKHNKNYIDSIMYQLEMINNITSGKRYGAKTLYEPYFEDKLNHITITVAHFRFLQMIDKSNFQEAKRISEIIKKSYRYIPFAGQRVAIIFSILFTDIVIDHNMKEFKRHFKWINEKEKMLCMKFDSDMKYNYLIYEKISNDEFDVNVLVNELLESDGLLEGERLSLTKMFNFLLETIEFYTTNGNSFVVKE